MLYKSYADLKRISKNSRILPDLVTINFIHAGTTEQHGRPSDESIKQKYRQFMNDPLKFMKDAIDRNAFYLLLEDLYRNNTDKGRAPNIPIVIMVKVL